VERVCQPRPYHHRQGARAARDCLAHRRHPHAGRAGHPADEPLRRAHLDDTIICRCERVTAGEIRDLIRQGYRDLNEIKAITRAAMGACGSKTCHSLIVRLFRDEGIILSDVTDTTRRPMFIEVPLKVFAGDEERRGGQP
jgi:bacterioferritin-associated ferredoxin